jgi:transposase
MEHADPPGFTPARLRSRRDGWTPERQRAFIGHVAAGMPCSRAVRAVGMSRQTLYALLRRPEAASFAAAREEAMRRAAVARRISRRENRRTRAALEGIEIPVTYRGRVVGTQIRYDNRQLIHLLNQMVRKGLNLW